MKPRTPKAVKAWMNRVDEAEREICTKNKEPYRKISNGLQWNGDVLIISGCAQYSMRDKEYLFDEFPRGYNYQKN